ncbi:MAG: hypothetical protein ACRECX_05745 [Methyloceanibacter sp.]|uniref:hypothetical protein n=1 Tax=Methyloceanibacter sp. TaxID=1965321 RepID=UPI003D6CAF6D
MLESALALLTLAMPITGTTVHDANMGPGDIPMGTFCRVQNVCVIAQTESDCGRIGGTTFPTLDACAGAASAAPQPGE